MLNGTSDRHFDGDIATVGQGNSTTGVVTQPRALNGYFSRQNNNGAANCINLCIGQAKGYTLAATNDNQCCTFLWYTLYNHWAFANVPVRV